MMGHVQVEHAALFYEFSLEACPVVVQVRFLERFALRDEPVGDDRRALPPFGLYNSYLGMSR